VAGESLAPGKRQTGVSRAFFIEFLRIFEKNVIFFGNIGSIGSIGCSGFPNRGRRKVA
jgi:hypothetical protein